MGGRADSGLDHPLPAHRPRLRAPARTPRSHRLLGHDPHHEPPSGTRLTQPATGCLRFPNRLLVHETTHARARANAAAGQRPGRCAMSFLPVMPAETRAVVGLDVGGTMLKAVALGPGGKVLDRRRRPTRASDGTNAVVDGMVALLKDLIGDREGAPPPAVGGVVP